jgi:hypothetical protein
VLKWVSMGGVLILMDETNNTRELAGTFGVIYGPLRMRIGKAYCTINGRRITVLFNIYRELKPTGSGCMVLCRVGGAPTAVRTRYGAGTVYIVGDSSIVINELYFKNEYTEGNEAFVNQMVGNRMILVYEGARNYTRGVEYGSATILTGLADWLRDSSSMIFRGSTFDVFARVSGLLLAVSIIVFLMYGLPRSPYPRSSEGEA